MLCPHCNRNIPDGSIFCLSCQEDISEEDRLQPRTNEKIAELDLTYRGIYFSDVSSHWNWSLEELSSDINSQLSSWFDYGWKIKNGFLLPSYLVAIRGTNWKAIGIDIAISAIFRTAVDPSNTSRMHVTGAKIPMIRGAESNSEELFYSVKNWYGFEYLQTDAEVKKTFSCYYDGLFVYIVTPNSPAQKSGLKFGDVIYKIDKKEVKTISDFDDAFTDTSIPDYPPWF